MQFVRGETLKLYGPRQERLFAIKDILKYELGFFLLVAGTKAALLWVKGSPAEPCRWRIYNLSAPAGYKAAVHLKVPIANCNTMNGSGDFNLIFKMHSSRMHPTIAKFRAPHSDDCALSRS
jgi:hypothetical protein